MKKIYKNLEIRVKCFDIEELIRTSMEMPTLVDEFDNELGDIFG